MSWRRWEEKLMTMVEQQKLLNFNHIIRTQTLCAHVLEGWGWMENGFTSNKDENKRMTLRTEWQNPDKMYETVVCDEGW